MCECAHIKHGIKFLRQRAKRYIFRLWNCEKAVRQLFASRCSFLVCICIVINTLHAASYIYLFDACFIRIWLSVIVSRFFFCRRLLVTASNGHYVTAVYSVLWPFEAVLGQIALRIDRNRATGVQQQRALVYVCPGRRKGIYSNCVRAPKLQAVNKIFCECAFCFFVTHIFCVSILKLTGISLCVILFKIGASQLFTHTHTQYSQFALPGRPLKFTSPLKSIWLPSAGSHALTNSRWHSRERWSGNTSPITTFTVIYTYIYWISVCWRCWTLDRDNNRNKNRPKRFIWSGNSQTVQLKSSKYMNIWNIYACIEPIWLSPFMNDQLHCMPFSQHTRSWKLQLYCLLDAGANLWGLCCALFVTIESRIL